MSEPRSEEVAIEVAPPVSEVTTYRFEVQRRRIEYPNRVVVQWRLRLLEGRKVVVQTEWKIRAQFLQELAQHQQGQWAEWVLQGIGRPSVTLPK